MPHAKYMTEDNIKAALDVKNITMDEIDDSCRRILSSYFAIPKAMRVPGPCGGGNCIDKKVKGPAHIALARKL
jgi:hypothetical protein